MHLSCVQYKDDMNMYKSKLAVAIKHNGKILRENKDTVYLPFGAEFTILVKNLNNVRVKFSIQIDGEDISDGRTFVLDGNKDVEIKRYVRNNNLSEGNAFKFIERSAQIEKGPRGIRIDDGIVRVEFWYEKEINHYTLFRNDMIGKEFIQQYDTWTGPASGILRNQVTACSVGITVPGSRVTQGFTEVNDFCVNEISDVIILKLVGGDTQHKVSRAVTVDVKPKCSTCGTLNKVSDNFCRSCGTSLKLY